MSAKHIEYRSGYKYQLATDYPIKTKVIPSKAIDTEFISLDTAGNLMIKGGYAWDGTSGPVADTRRNMRASLIHDALYQLMRRKHLSVKKHKDTADRLFKAICIEDGVPKPTATVYYQALKALGKPATDPKNAKKIKTAPA